MTTADEFLSTTDSRKERLADLEPSLRDQLETQRAFRAEQLAELGEQSETVEPPERQQVNAALAEAARWALAETEAALARMDTGRYGTCEHCAEPIPLERLEVIPHTRYCPACQEEHADPTSADV